MLNSVLNVKAVVAAFNQEKALVGAFSVITNLRMELFEALTSASPDNSPLPGIPVLSPRKGQTWGSPDCWQSLYRGAGATLHHVTMLRVTHNLLPSRLNCCANCSVQSYYRIILRHIVKVYLAQHKVHRDSVSTMGSGVQIYVTWHMVFTVLPMAYTVLFYLSESFWNRNSTA